MKDLNIKAFKQSRTIELIDEIDANSLSNFKKDLNEIVSNDEEIFQENYEALLTLDKSVGEAYRKTIKYPPIYLNICCPGGTIYHGLAIYDIIKSINEDGRHEIIAVVSGFAASMATIVMLACKKRYAHKHTSFLVHSVAGMAFGKLQDVVESADEMKRLAEILRSLYLKHTHLTEDQLDKVDNQKKDWWLTADEALSNGLITTIL